MKIHKLSNSEQQQSEKYSTSRAFLEYVSKEQNDARKNGLPWKLTLLSNTVQLARHLASLESLLEDLIADDAKVAADDDELVNVKVIDASPLWQLAFLNVKVRAITFPLRHKTN